MAAAANGNISRARLLASDAGFAQRQELWATVPDRLDGRGATAAVLAADLVASVEGVLEPLRERQAAELAQLDEQAKAQGARVRKGRRGPPAPGAAPGPHGRAAGRVGRALPRLSRPPGRRLDRPAAAPLDAIANRPSEALLNNPNETLLVQALLVRLSESQRPY